MRLAHTIIGILLVWPGSASAFECANVKLPSNVVICSDPELIRLADERQAAINEMRARIGEDNWSAFWENQKNWVRSYAAACGVPPDRPPPLPTQETVRDCFRRAAIDRIAYVRAYSPAKASDQETPGAPSFPPSTEVSLEFTHGIYVVPVLVNGILPLKFTVDSGAADVSLPADVFLTLIRTGTITNDDYIGTQKYRLADGSIVDSDRFYVHELKVGNQILRNIGASVQKVTSTPLLGQTFLSKFASWSMDNERHVLSLRVRGGPAMPGTAVSAIPTNSSPRPTEEKLASSSTAAVARPTEEHSALLCGQRINYVVYRRDLPPGDIAFLGSWIGAWHNSNQLCASVIVDEIFADGGVQALYYFGSGPGIRSKRLSGLFFGDDKISLRDDEGSAFEFIRSGDTLNASFSGKSGTMSGSFSRAAAQ